MNVMRSFRLKLWLHFDETDKRLHNNAEMRSAFGLISHSMLDVDAETFRSIDMWFYNALRTRHLIAYCADSIVLL